jgi:N6-L-threonylcarbamoyladenine synthase
MQPPLILAIESSCDETSAAVLRGREVLSNLIATQKIHERFGGVVPELSPWFLKLCEKQEWR